MKKGIRIESRSKMDLEKIKIKMKEKRKKNYIRVDEKKYTKKN